MISNDFCEDEKNSNSNINNSIEHFLKDQKVTVDDD